MSRSTRPVLQVDSQNRPLPASGGWNSYRATYYAGTTNLEYAGFAKPGTDTSAPAWQIFYCTYDGSNNLLTITWPINALGACSNDFEFIWDNRATYVFA